jgi:molybdopterin-binding protein
MNKKEGRIAKIRKDDYFNMITVDVAEGSIEIVDIKTPFMIEEGDKVTVKFKEIVVSLSKCDKIGKVISVENTIPSTITTCRKGDIFSEVTLQTPCGEIVSLISTPVLDSMGLCEGDDVTALLKGSDIKLEPMLEPSLASLSGTR